MQPIAILILAAGASSRMGGVDKLMQDIDAIPLLARVIARAMATGLPTYVTLPDLSHPRAQLVRDGGAIPVLVADWATGMAASIRAGIAALPEAIQGVMILPADMPDLQSVDLQDLENTARNAPRNIIRATTQSGVPGHPVIFPANLFAELQAISGDKGARAVISAHRSKVLAHPLPGSRAICDLDTPADWAAWRTAQQTGNSDN